MNVFMLQKLRQANVSLACMQTLFFGATMGCTKKHQTWEVLIYIFTPKIISERLIGTTHHP